MANLSGQNIGTNYKGILNLNTLNGNLTTTLQAVTDGDGNASPLRLSTTNTDIGIFTFLGGITNAFPAIKRNGAAIDFRLADDSGYSNITVGRILSFGTGASTIRWSTNLDNNQYNMGLTWYSNLGAVIEFSLGGDTIQLGSGLFGTANSTPAASAIIEGRSTTKGFLPPRMTTTQKNAITTPATGLVLYDTTLNKLAVYTGSAWETVTSV
jgi:hypothetical protein